MSNDYFKKALSDFTLDFASGGAIRAMADKGYSVKEIHERLDFPVSTQRIGEVVWQHYLDTKVILRNAPGTEQSGPSVHYEKVQDAYGRSSFRQVKDEADAEKNGGDREYVPCDFGKKQYQNPKEFGQSLAGLSDNDREYILGLPWPLQTVWHVKDERMNRIMKTMNDKK